MQQPSIHFLPLAILPSALDHPNFGASLYFHFSQSSPLQAPLHSPPHSGIGQPISPFISTPIPHSVLHFGSSRAALGHILLIQLESTSQTPPQPSCSGCVESRGIPRSEQPTTSLALHNSFFLPSFLAEIHSSIQRPYQPGAMPLAALIFCFPASRQNESEREGTGQPPARLSQDPEFGRG
jgi:hypothetical protein